MDQEENKGDQLQNEASPEMVRVPKDQLLQILAERKEYKQDLLTLIAHGNSVLQLAGSQNNFLAIYQLLTSDKDRIKQLQETIRPIFQKYLPLIQQSHEHPRKF